MRGLRLIPGLAERAADSPARRKAILLGLSFLAAVLTFLVYLPSLNNGFLNWDDPVYIYENRNIRSVGLDFFRWVSTAVISANWHPVTMLSHAIDYAFWGNDPFGHHLTSVIIHAINTFLVALLAIKLLDRNGNKNSSGIMAITAGVFTAVLFGVHPVHVESVAWASERKDVLCALFYLLSAHIYIKYALKNSGWLIYYFAALFLFALALMSKPMAVSLPAALLIIDFFALGRIDSIKSFIRRGVIEKLPFYLLALIFSAVTIYTQSFQAMVPLDNYPLGTRVLSAIKTCVFYLYKMLLPVGLAPFYPKPKAIDIFDPGYLAFALAFIAITVATVLLIRRKRLFAGAWAFYLVTLLPVIGIVQVGGQAAADRYTYLPSIAPFLLAGFTLGFFMERKTRFIKAAAVLSALFVTIILSYKTVRQIEVWKDPMSFWSYEISVYPEEPLAYINRGYVFEDAGDLEAALADFTKATELMPEYAENHLNRGSVLSALGRHAEAVNSFNEAIGLKPDYIEAYNNRGLAWKALKNYPAALDDFNSALRIDPNAAAVYHNMSLIYAGMGEAELAVNAAQKAAALGYR